MAPQGVKVRRPDQIRVSHEPLTQASPVVQGVPQAPQLACGSISSTSSMRGSSNTNSRWLAMANPELAALLTEKIGDGWQADLDRLDPGVRRLINPHVYHVSLTTELWQLKRRLVAETREAD